MIIVKNFNIMSPHDPLAEAERPRADTTVNESSASKWMTWSSKLAVPIAVKDGRTLVKLADARALVFLLSARQLESPHFRLAVRLLNEASMDWTMVSEAEAQIRIALKAEGWFRPAGCMA